MTLAPIRKTSVRRSTNVRDRIRCNRSRLRDDGWLGREGVDRERTENSCSRSWSGDSAGTRLCRTRSTVGGEVSRNARPASYRRRQPIQSLCYACNEWSAKFFVSDKENPYTTEPGKPFRWIRGRQVGGRSILWGRQSYRWSDLDFEANLRDGIAIDWPIRYADIAPWYDYVEDFVGISGEALGLPQLPDSH